MAGIVVLVITIMIPISLAIPAPLSICLHFVSIPVGLAAVLAMTGNIPV
jgi:hypothetical protein